MILFRDFTVPLWKIFFGNLLLFITIVFYIAWWVAAYRPDRAPATAAARVLIALAILMGAAAITIKFSGIETLSRAGKGVPVVYILLGAVAFYVILLAVTALAFRRPVTAELLLIIVWAALEGSAISVLQASGRFGTGQALTLTALLVLATGVGLFCYLKYYHLDDIARFWNGLIPLVVDAVVVALFLAVLALS